MILLTLVLSWGPIFIWKLISKKWWPSDYQKAMKFVNRKRIGTNLLK